MTLHYNKAEIKKVPKIKLTQVQVLDAADKELRKPFFITIEDKGVKKVEETSADTNKPFDQLINKPIQSQKDLAFIKMVVDDFEAKTWMEIKKKFTLYYRDTKNPIDQTNFDGLKDKIGSMAELKQLHYKASYVDEVSKIKIQFFFKYFDCDRPEKKLSFTSSCFEIMVFALKNKIWHESTISTSIEGVFWSKDFSFIKIDLTGLGDLSEDLNATNAMVPLPDESSPIYYLHFSDNKYRWSTTNTLRWSVAEEAEANKFEKWSRKYTEKYGGTGL